MAAKERMMIRIITEKLLSQEWIQENLSISTQQAGEQNDNKMIFNANCFMATCLSLMGKKK